MIDGGPAPVLEAAARRCLLVACANLEYCILMARIVAAMVTSEEKATFFQAANDCLLSILSTTKSRAWRTVHLAERHQGMEAKQVQVEEEEGLSREHKGARKNI